MHPVTLHIGEYSTDILSKLRPSYRANDPDFVVLMVCDAESSCICISLSWNKRFRSVLYCLPSDSRDSCKSTHCVTVRRLDMEVEHVYRFLNIRKRRCRTDVRQIPFLRTLLISSVTHWHNYIKRRVREDVCCHNAGRSQWLTTSANKIKIQP